MTEKSFWLLGLAVGLKNNANMLTIVLMHLVLVIQRGGRKFGDWHRREW